MVRYVVAILATLIAYLIKPSLGVASVARTRYIDSACNVKTKEEWFPLATCYQQSATEWRKISLSSSTYTYESFNTSACSGLETCTDSQTIGNTICRASWSSTNNRQEYEKFTAATVDFLYKNQYYSDSSCTTANKIQDTYIAGWSKCQIVAGDGTNGMDCSVHYTCSSGSLTRLVYNTSTCSAAWGAVGTTVLASASCQTWYSGDMAMTINSKAEAACDSTSSGATSSSSSSSSSTSSTGLSSPSSSSSSSTGNSSSGNTTSATTSSGTATSALTSNAPGFSPSFLLGALPLLLAVMARK